MNTVLSIAMVPLLIAALVLAEIKRATRRERTAHSRICGHDSQASVGRKDGGP